MNEVIKTISNLIIFLRKDFASTKRIQANKKLKKQHFYAHKKTSKGEESRFGAIFAFCAFCAFCVCKSFS